MNCLIIGGSKSGKSELGEKIALKLNPEKILYLATMKAYDKEDKERIKKHISNRAGFNFITIEIPRNLHEIVENISNDDTVLIDSITSLLTNEMFMGNQIIENPNFNILNGIEQIIIKAKNTVIISDYIFNDAIEYDKVTENFKRELATINKKLTKICDKVIECSFGNIKNIK